MVFRARSARSSEQALQYSKNPQRDVGQPPPESARAGRMNPTGISVFYGALGKDTAVAEVRPPVGSLVVVAGFRPTRKLRLLNLPRIDDVYTGSIFCADYESKAARRAFLEGFHRLIASPVQPHDEPLEYIPTQAVAEYVAHVLGFDGILYASAQIGAVPEQEEPSPYIYHRELGEDRLAEHNLVLLGSAASITRKPPTPTEQLDDQGAVAAEYHQTLVVDPSSVEVRIVKSVTYSHDIEYIYDPDQVRRSPFPI